jgi:hypothetical protein
MNAKIKNTLLGLLRSKSFRRRGTQTPLKGGSSAAEEIRISSRISPLQERLLAEFVLPNSTHAIAKSPYWKMMFGEPVNRVLRGLEEQGLLIEPNDPRARMCFGRDESDLRMLCLDCGLEPTGSAVELTDRLLVIDPTGWLMGYAGELLQCSELAAQAMGVRHRAQSRIERGASGNDAMWEMLKKHALQTAREGNLLRCRHVHLTMANHLLRRNKHSKALHALYIVCVFDLCGARNRGDAPGETGQSYSRFDCARASLAPGVVRRVRNLAHEMMLSVDEMRKIFFSVIGRLPIPKDSRRLWAVLHLALSGELDPDDAARCSQLIQNLLD